MINNFPRKWCNIKILFAPQHFFLDSGLRRNDAASANGLLGVNKRKSKEQ
ncbi:MAG: hypothetical protein Q7U91_07230 [Sideroxyarcus sp.]|nr:hypothetical protein [Sideroxyarcus sp.]